MPDMDGLETYEKFKNQSENLSKDSPVVILTANALVGDREYYLSLGFNSYLSKPIDPEALEETVYKLLPKNKITVSKEQETKDIEPKDLLASEMMVTTPPSFKDEFPGLKSFDFVITGEYYSDTEGLKEALLDFSATIPSIERELDKALDLLENNSDADGKKLLKSLLRSLYRTGKCLGAMKLTTLVEKLLSDQSEVASTATITGCKELKQELALIDEQIKTIKE
nr:response regulator [Lachnospiraceae bacterium]